jgi:DnaJ domain/PilZ domain
MSGPNPNKNTQHQDSFSNPQTDSGHDRHSDRQTTKGKKRKFKKSEEVYQMRAESRLDTEDLRCSKGRVADITGSGMRLIISPDDLPQINDVQSYTFKDRRDEITITGTVKWIRKGTVFTRRCEVGVEFTKLDPTTRDAIIKLAVTGKMGLTKEREVSIGLTNLYKILGITQHASSSEIQTAFRVEAKRWHPDVNDAPEAAQHFDEVQKAYAVLSDEISRANYDARFFSVDTWAA